MRSIHALRGRSSTHSEGGLPRAPSTREGIERGQERKKTACLSLLCLSLALFLSLICLSPCAQRRYNPTERCAYRPFSRFLIVNKLLSLAIKENLGP